MVCVDLLEQEHDQKECLYWIALTYYGLGEYRASRSHCERLIRMDPNHTKALALHDCIKEVIASGASRMHVIPTLSAAFCLMTISPTR
jgi:hypothetical protein